MRSVLAALTAALSLSLSAGEQPPAGRLNYFTPEALAAADVTGLDAEISARLAAVESECAAAEKTAAVRPVRERDMILTRVELARRLAGYVRTRLDDGAKDMLVMAWQGAEELGSFFTYFAAERRRDVARAALPEPVVLNVRDFGAKGDGKTDDGPAFRKAYAAAADRKGAPVVLKVPAGVYQVAPDAAKPPEKVTFASLRDYSQDGLPTSRSNQRPWKDYGAGFHLTAHAMSYFTVEGETGTEICFTDATRGGFGFWGCTETAVRNLTISYRDNPSTQGTVVAIEKDPLAVVFKRDVGYPDPDDPRFLNARSNRFTPHEGPDQLYSRRGTARMGKVERLSSDTFRLVCPDHMKKDATWNGTREGDRISILARYSESAKGFPVYFMLSSFSGVEGVTIYDAPGQNVILSACFAMRMLDCTVRVRPGSDDLVSSNADGMMCSGPILPYVAGCRFEHMEDDTFNFGTPGGSIAYMPEDRRSFERSFWVDGRSAFLVDAVTGRVKAFLRRDGKAAKLATPLPADTITEKDVPKLDPKEFVRRNAWVGTAGERKADRLLQIPGSVGGVIKDTEVFDSRGMGAQVHCADMLIDNLRVRHMTGPGANVNPLFGWGMLFNVHSVVVRNSRFADCSSGLVVQPGCVQPGVKPVQRMIQDVVTYDNVFELPTNRPAFVGANCYDLAPEGVRFTLKLQREPNTPESVVTSASADRILMYVRGNEDEILFLYTDPKSPVRQVRAFRRRDGEDSVRWRLEVKPAKGWRLLERSGV